MPTADGNAREILRTVLTAIGVAVAAMTALWGLAVKPIEADITGLQAQVANVRVNYLTKESSVEYRSRVTDGMERIRMDFARVDWEIKELNRNQISRVEVAGLQRQLDEINRRIGDLYPLSKVLEDLSKRVESLQQRQAAPASNSRP